MLQPPADLLVGAICSSESTEQATGSGGFCGYAEVGAPVRICRGRSRGQRAAAQSGALCWMTAMLPVGRVHLCAHRGNHGLPKA